MNTKPHPTPDLEVRAAAFEAWVMKTGYDPHQHTALTLDSARKAWQAAWNQHESETTAERDRLKAERNAFYEHGIQRTQERDRLRQEVELLVKQIEYILQNDHSLNAELIMKVLTKQSTRTLEKEPS